jgi:hypothetical protein
MNNTANIVDNLIYMVTVLFTLSVITEKLTQLVRNYPLYIKVVVYVFAAGLAIALFNSWVGLSPLERGLIITLIVAIAFFAIGKMPLGKRRDIKVFKNIGKKNVNKREQEKEINLLSMLLGLLIAFLFNTNLFEMFTMTSFRESSWNGDFPFDFEHFRFNVEKFKFSWLALFGLLLTGFFLTFGSKFFHDLLDLLLEVKNQRKNLNQNLQDNEVNLIRLQMDRKASILPHVQAEQKARLEDEIQVLKAKLSTLLKAAV